MMIDFFELIDDYMLDKLSVEDRAAFEKELMVNSRLKSYVDRYDITKEISFGFLDVEVKEIAKQVEKEKSVIKLRKWTWAAASVIFLSIVGYFYLTENLSHEHPTYADVYIEPAWPINRSNEIDTLSDAIKIALDGNIQVAIRMIKYTNTDKHYKMLLISELFAKEGVADSTLLYLPSQSNNKQTRDRINYLKIISYYNLNNHKLLNIEIQKLPDDTDEKYMKIYEKIK